MSLLKSDPSTLLSRGLVSDTGTPDTYCVVAAADTGERRCPQNEPPLNSHVLQEVACPNVTPNYGPSLGSGNIQARSLSVGGRPGYCGGLSSFPTHSMPGALLVVTTTGGPRYCLVSPVGAGSPWVRPTDFLLLLLLFSCIL